MHDKTYNKTCDQHPRRLIRVFADRMCLLQLPSYQKRNKRECFPYWVCVEADRRLCWYYCRVCSFRRITKTRLFKYIKNFSTKHWKFSDKNSDIFHISAQNNDCGYSIEPPRLGGSNEYPQSLFLSRNKKNIVYPCQPHFYYIKVGFKGSYGYVFVMCRTNTTELGHQSSL